MDITAPTVEVSISIVSTVHLHLNCIQRYMLHESFSYMLITGKKFLRMKTKSKVLEKYVFVSRYAGTIRFEFPFL